MTYSAQEVNSRLPYAFGEELSWLTQHAQQFTLDTQVVMLGAGPGVMALALYEGAPAFNFTIVDKFSYDTAQAHCKAAGHNLNTTTFALCDSVTYGLNYEGPCIQLLIVDADHSYKAVLGDIIAWYPHLCNDALVFFHDVVDLEQNGTNGVRQAIHRAIELGYKLVKVDEVGVSEVYKASWMS